MIYGLYSAVLAAVTLGYLPVAVARRLVRGVPINLRARLGRGKRAPVAGPCGWIHAVSVGEAIAAAPVVEGLRRTYPALPLVVTTVTETGARVVRERFAGVATHRYFPLDFRGPVRRVADAMDPAFFVGMETELWPNLLRELARRGVPVMLANGRLSDRSFRRYRLVRGLMHGVLGHVTVFGMQSQEDARRIIALGADPERVVVTGNVKTEPLADASGVADLWRRLLALRPDERVLIAGSTHRGEDDVVLDAYRALSADVPGLVLVLAPRHPERVAEVLTLIRSRGLFGVRRSDLPAERRARAVIVLDTIGELAQLYAVADVVFVGGSLAPFGGHNMLEPALRRKPVLFGPHTENFRDAAALLVGRGAATVVTDAATLAAEVRRLIEDPALAARRGDAAWQAVATQQGAVRETLELVARFLYPKPPA